MIGSLKKWWKILENKPFGKQIFSYFVGKLIPYTGSIKPFISIAKPGLAEVLLKDKKFARNHLGSLHALALSNAGELCTGIALHFILKNHARAILTELKVNFLKKARGTIKASAQINPSVMEQAGHITITATLCDEKKNQVAIVWATWKYENNT